MKKEFYISALSLNISIFFLKEINIENEEMIDYSKRLKLI